jgi:hypothetical protein
LQHLQDVGASTFTLYGIICSIFKLKSFIARDLQQQGFAAQVWPEFTVAFLEMSEKSGLCHCVCSRLLFLFGLVVAMFQRIRSFNHVVNSLQLSFPYFEVMCGEEMCRDIFSPDLAEKMIVECENRDHVCIL